ncbi:MAG: UDP-N-acetylglucosamine 2-epimerase (hydrolyzing) [Bacteroidetes bacterium]|nr:UDP-N-acetylglucosamine 2-epimerase (hydrolyzing) [Bacteroidota bacterium]
MSIDMKRKKKIIAITGARSEYDLMSPLFKKIELHENFELSLIVTGSHLSENFGLSLENIKKDQFFITDELYTLVDSNKKIGRIVSTGNQIAALAHSFHRLSPDLVIVAGDREEVISATMTAAFLSIPVAHFFGGDVVKDGNIDNSIRYASAKFAHLHFVTIEEHRQTLLKLGEPADRIFVVGSPALDKFNEVRLMDRTELSENLGFDIATYSYMLLIQHPIITETNLQKEHIDITLAAVKETGLKVLINYPNSDAGNKPIVEAIMKFAENNPNVYLFKNLDRDVYVNVMRHATCMIGNSSSGLHEAPSVGLPAINVGSRQRGRLHAENVLFVNNDLNEISEALRKAIYDVEFRNRCKGLKNPYGDGYSSDKVVQIIDGLDLNPELICYKDITY